MCNAARQVKACQRGIKRLRVIEQRRAQIVATAFAKKEICLQSISASIWRQWRRKFGSAGRSVVLAIPRHLA